MKEPVNKTVDKLGKKGDKKTLVLLDSHAIIHRAYHALPDFASSTGAPTGALYGLSTMLMGILEKFKPNYIVACYDLPQPTYRHEAYKDYKGGRKKTDDALVEQLKSSRNIFEAFNIPMVDKVGFEADDMLGTIVHEVLDRKEMDNINIVIASGDMDTLQLVTGDRVRVFTLKKGIKDTVIYNEDAVRERYQFGPLQLTDYKGLRGDPSDNIIGIAGVGEKTATTLITSFGSIEGIYEALEKDPNLLKQAGISDRMIELLDKGKEEALFSKMLATIRRDAPIDFKLPDEEWKSTVSISKIEELFRDYEFRSLIPRVRQVLTGSVNGEAKKDLDTVIQRSTNGGEQKSNVVNNGSEEQEGLENAQTAEHQTAEQLFIAIDPLLEKKLKIAVSVLNSTITDPTLDDVFAITKTYDANVALEKLESAIKAKNMDRILYEIEWPLIPILEQMKEVGIKIDVDFLKNLGREYHKKLRELETKIWKESGQEFNINSPKQMGEILFDKMGLGGKNIKKTAGGAKSTKESELEKMKGTHPIIDLILEYRELAKLLGTYIDVLPTLVDEKNRIHPDFIQMGASTGRMATQNPGVQNIPIKTELGRAVREAFISEDGYTLVSFDYSQIELRVAAILSGDEKLIDIFKNGIDVHTGVAAQVFGVAEKDVTKEMRRQAKVINFGILYGMGVNALKANLGSTQAEARAFYDNYFKTFKGVAEYLNKVKFDTAQNGYTETLFGRRRYFEGINSKLPFIRAAAERMAINAPIQGTATADMVKISMNMIHAKLKALGMLNDVRLLLQVHDELVFEIRTPEVKKMAIMIKQTMESVLTEEQSKGVPIVTSANAGKNWNKLEALEL
ncbi:MAG: polymerase [Patescibacteria group bacterium]|nr:polymerase [Patescibacteria group bacterium]